MGYEGYAIRDLESFCSLGLGFACRVLGLPSASFESGMGLGVGWRLLLVVGCWLLVVGCWSRIGLSYSWRCNPLLLLDFSTFVQH